jgi:high-affinity nickel permease
MIGQILALGFVLGMAHATDADHVVAVATIVSERRSVRAAARVGALWGVGHTLTVMLFGGAILALKLTIPPAVGLSLELGVALMLLGLGGRALVRARAEAQRHDHPEVAETHAHVHALGLPHRHGSHAAPRGTLESLAVGLVHGLAGSAAVALAVLTQVGEARLGLGYLALFGLGTIVGMMLVTTAVAFPFVARWAPLARHRAQLRGLGGVFSVALGLALVYDIGIHDGLFLGAPVWSPH